MVKEVLDYKENILDLKKRLEENVNNVKYCDEISNILEYSSDDGVLFSVEIKENSYIFNFGDYSYEVNNEAIGMIMEMITELVVA